MYVLLNISFLKMEGGGIPWIEATRTPWIEATGTSWT
jgi:hypothetical protein